MGFNFGAFAGGLAKSGVDTYTRLSEEERRDAEAKRQVDIHKAFLRNEQENERLSALSNETFGRVGQTDTSALSPREQDNPSVPDLQTGLPQGFQAKPYTAEQAAAEFKTRAMGINPLKAADYQAKLQGVRRGELELLSIERAAKQDKAFDTHMEETHKSLANMRQDIQGTFDTDGMNGLVKKYGSDFKDATGNSVALMGNALVIKDSKGKVVGQPVTRPEDAINALSNVLGKRAMEASLEGMVTKGLFRNSAELMDYFTKRNNMETQTSNAQSSRISALASQTSANASAQNAATQASIAPSTIAQNQAQAAMYTAHAGVYAQTLEVAKSNKEAREAMQPYLDKIAEITDPGSAEGRKEFERLSMQAMAAGAKKSSDIKGLLDSMKKADKSQLPEIDPKLKEAAYKEYSEAGTDPKALAAVKAKYPGVFGPSALDKAIADKAKQSSAPAAAPAAALPRMDQDDIPRPNTSRALPQGAYVPNARTLLNTPKYGVLGTGTFNPND